MVRYNFDDTADFSKFKTYKWIALEKVAPIDELTDQQIKTALDAALAQKVLTKVEGDTADQFIGYQTTEQIEQKLAGFDAGWSTGVFREQYQGVAPMPLKRSTATLAQCKAMPASGQPCRVKPHRSGLEPFHPDPERAAESLRGPPLPAGDLLPFERSDAPRFLPA
jgi:hypothetical protein